MFLNPSMFLEPVEQPCKNLFAHPVQCFQEMFLATPAVVGTLFLGIGGFAVAVAIWGALLIATLMAALYLLKQVFRGLRYIFQQTKVGQKVSSFIPFKSHLQRFFCKAQEVQPKKLISSQVIGDYGANIVSKVHTDGGKWFKSAFKFTKGSGDDNGPSRTPQRSTSRLSGLTPKLLSPKVHKQ